MQRKGFTLIELLIVISIIGILASIVLVGLGSFRARGRDVRRVADLRSTQNALEIYFTRFSSYPATQAWAALDALLVAAGIGVNNIPDDPLNTGTYVYQYAADPPGCAPGGATPCLNYVLDATLEDATNQVLANDVDGTVYTVNCADPDYCVQF